MKYNLVVFLMLLVTNVLAGLIFKGYEWQNVGFSSIVLIANFLFVILLQTINLKDAFKITLSFFLPFMGIIELILAILAPVEFYDNVYLMGIIGLIVFQIFVFLVINVVSQKVD